MDAEHDPLAGFKTVAPALDGTIDRPAALAALRRTSAPARWLTGPSGSGKSTLVARELAGRAAPLLWYRLDARDDDPAFFYPAFAAALARSAPGREPPPAFADDERPRADAFAERFFAAVVARFGDLALVLDDAHRIEHEPMQRALARFVALVPRDGCAWFVSEQPPPAPFFDAIGERRLALCNDVPLAFDAAECQALATALRLTTIGGEELAALTGGHAGALVLACEFLRGSEGRDAARERVAIGHVYRHLLGHLLDRMPAAQREVLTRTSFASEFDARVVRELAGDAAVGELPALRARGLLRATTTERGTIYEAHGLVRRALRALVEEQAGAEGARAAAERTADVLQASGFDEDAFALLAGHAAFARAAQVLEPIAERYARRGQGELVMRALARLPEDAVAARPWLCFWAGQALIALDEEAARGWFERAHAGFERAHDAAGMRLAAARVVVAFGLEYGDLRTLDAWMERHARAGGHAPVEPGSAHETVLALGLLHTALTHGAHPPGVDADALVRRLRVLVDDERAWLTPHEPVVAARLLIDHARIFGAPERAKVFVVETRAHAEKADVSALQRGRWYIAAASIFYNDGDHEQARGYLDSARRLAQASGSHRLAFELGMACVDAHLKRRDMHAATAELARLESLASHAPPAQRAEYARITARTLLMQDRVAEGLRWAEQAVDTARTAGYSGAHVRLYWIEHMYALAANERFAQALALAESAMAEQDERQRDAVIAIRDALRFLASDGSDVDALAQSLRRADAMGFVNLLSRARAPLARLCQAALVHGLHVDFVRRVIAMHRLDPPPRSGPEWPWAVTIRTLGGFELTLGGERYQPAHKTQDKPLDLLKLLVTCLALGRESVDREWAAQRLWPDADGANARKSLDMTVSRLRKLLRDDDAIALSEGRLRLSPARTWNDITPLMRALRHAGAHRDAHARGAMSAVEAAGADIAAVLDHYHGRFLPEEGDAPWLIAGREAVAAAVRSALLIADAVLEGRDDARLVPALERALAADPTSEDLARALMRALARRGEHAEAIRVYRRLREMLSIILGMPPSRETEQLRNELYARAPAGDAVAPAATQRTSPR
jgi:ATP/maltotriose-dependent transcriptional regulator MalT/DNA-binding SARP family transcriptional activator